MNNIRIFRGCVVTKPKEYLTKGYKPYLKFDFLSLDTQITYTVCAPHQILQPSNLKLLDFVKVVGTTIEDFKTDTPHQEETIFAVEIAHDQNFIVGITSSYIY